MAQVELIRQGDAKTFCFQINTVSGPLNLGGYESCEMYLYAPGPNTDYSNPIMTWSSTDPSQAVFYDRVNGIVRYYILSTQTNNLDPAQYPYRAKLTKDSEHVYTIHDGIIEITE
jgi:hypothetical protein